MLQPKRTKFRKAHKGRIHGNAKGGTQLNFGGYGLKATSPARLRRAKSKQLEEPLHVIFVVLAVFGFASFLTYLFHQSLQKYVWVKVRVTLNIG